MMASRVMHYCIASLLADRLGMDDRDEFMLGGIAPDIHGLMGVPKGVTHFKDTDSSGESRINYLRFYNTYRNVIDQPFYLGYLCHLVSDVVWLDTYFKIVPPTLPSEEWQQKLRVCYRDFERLNGRIIKQYSLKLHQHVIPEINIEGYEVEYLPILLDCMQRDFSTNESLMAEPLEIFRDDNSEIAEYINRAVDRCVTFLTRVGIPSRGTNDVTVRTKPNNEWIPR